MDIVWAVITGIAIFVVGQVLTKFLVEPWHDYRMCIGRIAHAVVIYGQAHSDPKFVGTVPEEEARRELMSLSGELLQRTYAIPAYGLFARLPRVASWEEIRLASGHLGGLAKNLSEVGGTRNEHIATIRKALRLHDPSTPLPVRRSLRQRIAVRRRTRRR